MGSPTFDEREQLTRGGRGVVWRPRSPSQITDRVDGLDLARCLRASGPFAIDRAIDVTRQLLAALEVVHGDGTVHADVQPVNVVVENCHDGEVISLVDFGGTRDAAGACATEYLAPEVIAGHAPTPRSDLYAVGVILYELLTGVPPYTGRTAIEVMQHQLHDTPAPPTLWRREIPAALERACLRAMSREPSRRFPDARSFADALRPRRDVDAMWDD